MRIEDYPTEPRFTATVLSSERITEDASDVEVRELVLEVDEHKFDFEIGQSIGILVSGPAMPISNSCCFFVIGDRILMKAPIVPINVGAGIKYGSVASIL